VVSTVVREHGGDGNRGGGGRGSGGMVPMAVLGRNGEG
jgi:hypothetical protein